jgi:PAS domain S-box-containing protein
LLIDYISKLGANKNGMKTTKQSKVSEEIIESLPIAVYTCDKDGYITSYNNAAAILWGRNAELGKDHWCGSWKIFQLNGNPLKLEDCPMAIALKEGRPVNGVELIIERPDGSQRYVKPYPTPLFDSNGVLIGAVNMMEDITDRKMTDCYARNLIEATLDPLITIDIEGMITDVNEAMVKATDKPREGLIGTPLITYFVEPAKAREVYKEIFNKGYVMNSPLIIIDGVFTDVLLNVRFIRMKRVK